MLGPCFLHKPLREFIQITVHAVHKGMLWGMQDTVDVTSAGKDFWLVMQLSMERMTASLRRNRIPVSALSWEFHEQQSWI